MGLSVRARGARHSNLTKIPLVYRVSYFNLGGLGAWIGEAKPTKAPRGGVTVPVYYSTKTFSLEQNCSPYCGEVNKK